MHPLIRGEGFEIAYTLVGEIADDCLVRATFYELDDPRLNAQPEYDDLVRLARAHARPVKDVQALAAKAWLER